MSAASKGIWDRIADRLKELGTEPKKQRQRAAMVIGRGFEGKGSRIDRVARQADLARF